MLIAPAGNGVYIEYGEKICIDADRAYKRATHMSTHAHSDHLASAKHTSTIATELTAKIGRMRGYPYLEAGEIPHVPAGHIPGSAQIVLENGVRVVVTGDFKLEEDVLGEKAEVPKTDVLVLETTFFSPEYVFPSREEIYEKIKNLVGNNVDENTCIVFFAYEVGKAQEITALLNRIGIVPSTTKGIKAVNDLFGFRSKTLTRDADVYVLPPRYKKYLPSLSLSLEKKIISRFLSGWSRDTPLSSHADFLQTLDYVSKADPWLIVTYGANKERGAKILKKMGYDAVPLRKPILL